MEKKSAIMNKLRKITINNYFIVQTLFFISLCFIYNYIISPVYGYGGLYGKEFDIYRIIIAISLYIACFILYKFVKGHFYQITFQCIIFFSIVPTCCYLIYNDININILIIQTIPLIFLTVVSRIDNFKITSKKIILNEYKLFIILIFLIILTIPFYLRLNIININNLLFKEVYETRLEYRTIHSAYMGYASPALSKILYPLMMIFFIDKRRYILAFISLINILVIYLTAGAQKDIIVGLALITFCYFFSSKKGIRLFIKKLISLVIILIFIEMNMYFIFNLTFLTTYIRRIFFVHPALFSKYYDYFSTYGFTYYKQTRLGSIGTERFYLTSWAGQNIFGRESLNANIGIFAEGYVSNGFLGVIIASILFVFICIYVNKLNIGSKYLGLWIAMLYLINYSLFETLMITHGMLLFCVVAYFFIPENLNNTISGSK